MKRKSPMQLVLITGMSGSGKSIALGALEDAGYYCIDNLPPELLEPFVALENERRTRKVAIAMDVRSATSLPLVLGGVPAELSDPAYLAAQRVRICLQGHQPFMAAVGAVHASLKALREGVAPGKLPNLPPPDLVKDASREADYAAWAKGFLGGGR